MYSIPIGVVPKSHSLDLHLVTVHSAREHALNSFIPHADSSIKLNSLKDFGSTLHAVFSQHGHPPTWLFKSNVSAAYQHISMHPLWQIKQINTFEGLQHVDHNMAFRTHTTPRIWCSFLAW